jgi:Mannosyltransferase (PIG-V)
VSVRSSTPGGSVVVEGPRLSVGAQDALREAWSALWTSRLVVWAAGMLGVLWFGRVPNSDRFDPVGVTHGTTAFNDLLVAPAARWDAVWYLAIARDGYHHDPNTLRDAFYPLYPLLIHIGNWVLGSRLLVAILISLGCFLVALALLYRLAEIELGAEDARSTLLLLSFFPSAFVFSAIYTESLFLMLSVGAFLAARKGRWAWAGALGALAAATRNSGIVLLVPLVVLFLYGPRADREPDVTSGARWRPRYRLGPQMLWLALVPLGLAAFLGFSAITFHDALAPFHVQRLWYRHFHLLGGLTGGAKAAWHTLRDLADSKGAAYDPGSGNLAQHFAGLDLVLFGFLVFALVGFVGVLRRLPIAYGAYVGVALLTTLSYPSAVQPLEAFPRYIVVLFPLQMWFARWCGERSRVARAVGVSAVLLGVLAAQWSRWAFVL